MENKEGKKKEDEANGEDSTAIPAKEVSPRENGCRPITSYGDIDWDEDVMDIILEQKLLSMFLI